MNFSLFRKHYKEYLVYKINQNHIDPLPLCHEPGPLRAMLLRDEKKVPDQQAGETEEQYCERLREVILLLCVHSLIFIIVYSASKMNYRCKKEKY